MWNLEDIIEAIDVILNTKRKRHMIGGVLVSTSLFFGGLAFAVVSLKGDIKMKNKLIYFAIFAVGACIGSGVTWKLVRDKYEKLANEEIESVKKAFTKGQKDLVNELEMVNQVLKSHGYEASEEKEEKPPVKETREKPVVKSTNYNNYTKYSSGCYEEEGVDIMRDEDRPYVIAPEEFGEFDNYECVSLTYYADKRLADDMDELVDDIEATVGYDCLDTFGDYEDDSVFVRNDRMKCDFEILLDTRKYRDVVGDDE